MLIRNIVGKHEAGQYRVQADVTAHASNTRETVYFSVDEKLAEWIRPQPNAFMVGSALAAMHTGETELDIDDGVDPQLVDRVTLAMRLLLHGHRSPLRPVKIVAPAMPHPLPDLARSTTALFLSGGVDSLSTMYWNTSRYPRKDPRRVAVAFFAHGLDVGNPNERDRPDIWQSGIERLSRLCDDLGVAFVPVRINFRNLAKHWRFYSEWQFASLLAAIAHAASARVHRCLIASDCAVEHIHLPWGSHPWLNGYYGADFLDIASGETEQFSRLERVKLILDAREEAIDALRVCWETRWIPEGYLNCGRCAKCVRTMLQLPVLDKLAATNAFPTREVTPALLDSIAIRTHFEVTYFTELATLLEASGRKQHATIVRKKLLLFNAEHTLGLNRMRPVVKKILRMSDWG